MVLWRNFTVTDSSTTSLDAKFRVSFKVTDDENEPLFCYDLERVLFVVVNMCLRKKHFPNFICVA